ncbi:DUF1772 domain-containing protein [Ilyomonas limi]|uniref:DUF1772 domain-containing protein n=1 Tax=Ilyomonas limi TaxID=2575867 RepID=A0A4U3L6R5_9BACT|nr:anthrone oxygenase family protein [Ilyomonas limi]TKK70941.1 DUF1772 domain-containing protein [Ilyomonas limi]
MKHSFICLSALFLLMLITGVFWGTWFTLTRSIEDFSAAEFIHIGKVIIANVAVPMRIIMPAGILLMLLSLWQYKDKKSAGFYAGLLSFVLIIIVLLVTLLILVPVDNRIQQWTTAIIPHNWEDIRDKWDTFHTVRTFASLASFALFSWSVVTAGK